MADLSSEVELAATPGVMEQIDRYRITANQKLDGKRRAELGQYMTPAPIARFMAGLFECHMQDISLLDAGAGVGSLVGAFVDTICERQERPRSLVVTAYEIEPTLLPYLRETLDICAVRCESVGIAFSSEIIAEDFIAHAVGHLTSPLFAGDQPAYTCAILNPPYRKIGVDSPHRRHLQRIGIETSNLYAGFLGVAIKLLAAEGELVAITPRSFCNGPYFRPFRQLLLDEMTLRRFHLFDSRIQAFADDSVLQENIIFSAVKSLNPAAAVTITSSEGPANGIARIREIPYTQVVYPNDPQRFIHIASDELGAQFAARAVALTTSLIELGLSVSTGRVVDFRAAPFLRMEPDIGTAPLIYPMHLVGGSIIWPKPSSKKPNALVRCRETEDLFVPTGYYVLVRRFSSKEERRRVVATVYDPTTLDSQVVGFENHLNYFHHNGRGMDPILARGLAVFLNSTFVDSYVRQFNGHTQINATDLRTMRYPTREQLLALGARATRPNLDQDAVDLIVAQELQVDD